MRILGFMLSMLMLWLASLSAKADLILNLEGVSGSSQVTVQISGSLTSQTNAVLGVTINGFAPFVQSDFTFAPLTPPLVMEVNRAGNTVSTTNVTHIRSSSGGTALILEIGPDQSAAANDLFLFSGTSTFTLPGLTFDDLLPGSYTGTPELGFVGTVTLNIVATPEPGSLWLIVAAGGSIGWLRTRWRAKAMAK